MGRKITKEEAHPRKGSESSEKTVCTLRKISKKKKQFKMAQTRKGSSGKTGGKKERDNEKPRKKKRLATRFRSRELQKKKARKRRVKKQVQKIRKKKQKDCPGGRGEKAWENPEKMAKPNTTCSTGKENLGQGEGRNEVTNQTKRTGSEKKNVEVEGTKENVYVAKTTGSRARIGSRRKEKKQRGETAKGKRSSNVQNGQRHATKDPTKKKDPQRTQSIRLGGKFQRKEREKKKKKKEGE